VPGWLRLLDRIEDREVIIVPIRKAVKADAPALAKLKHEVEGPLYQSYGTEAEHREDMARYASVDYIDENLAAANTTIYLAEDQRGIIGMVAATAEPDSCFIFSLVARYKRAGIGSALVRAAVTGTPDDGSGHNRVWCEVFEDNVGARRFFERLGFQEFGRRASMSYLSHTLLQLQAQSAEVLRRLSEGSGQLAHPPPDTYKEKADSRERAGNED